MFNLIVAVISIALIAAMAAASIFYGGASFSSSTAKAQASTLVNNGQQISGGQQLYMIDNSGNRNSVNDMGAANGLVTLKYLQAVPTPPSGVTVAPGWRVAATGEVAYIGLDTAITGQNVSAATTICTEVIAQGGGATQTSALTAASLTDDLLVTGAQFGCVSSGGNLNAGSAWFVYRL